MALIRSKDRKVTNAVSPNGKTPTIANSFGLPAGKAYSCPGATTVCEKVCYAGKLEKVYKGVRNILVSNYEQLLACDGNVLSMAQLLGRMIEEFIVDCEKRNAEKLFRIHWDGDFFSEEYTQAWRIVIALNPTVQFWAYTRSDFAVQYLYDLENLGLYFSTDSANRSLGIRMKKQYGIKLAYLANTFAEGKEDFTKLQEKSAVPCPENNKKIKLISEQGSACVLCSQCVFARNDILFSVTKK